MASLCPQCASCIPGRASPPSYQRSPTLRVPPLRPLTIDWGSADTWFAVGAGVLGLGVGIGAPTVYVLLQEQDEKKLQELRELNRKSKEETGEYMSEEEIAEFRKPRWTDRRQFEDDD